MSLETETVRGSVTQVVAALIWDGPRFLACQRPASKKRGLLWEFAGGKVEPGETKEEALVRECREELDITVAVDEVFMTVVHEYADMTVELTLFSARIREGEPKLLEHAALAWITADEAGEYPFCPADVEILARLKRTAGNLIVTEKDGMRAVALLPDGPFDTAVWLHEDFLTAARIRERLSACLPAGKVPVLLTSDSVVWDRDLSPWPAEGVFRGQTFTGEAEAYRIRLTEELIPEAERSLPFAPVRRFIAGYSLAGLFSLWSAFRCGCFSGVASVSGSLWYDGFTEFVRDHDLSREVKALYLSLGDREKNAKNPRMAKVEEATGEIARILREKTGLPVPFELNPGGHFRDVPERMEKAILSLIKETEEK
ncbi:MAG: NUDIX domain-containing protein [Ruminococcaceae bacterium]|jgi:8-oxo-dGTP diphosphatase|nr:NUDIX domain-containing protein [Oscillospiraceae bacterium]